MQTCHCRDAETPPITQVNNDLTRIWNSCCLCHVLSSEPFATVSYLALPAGDLQAELMARRQRRPTTPDSRAIDAVAEGWHHHYLIR